MAGHGKKKKRGDDHGEHPDERWLVTYADLMTLLVALFMVLFSISSVNKSKFESLQQSLQDAFSGRILPGGRSIKEAGGTDNIANPAPSAPVSSLQPYVGGRPKEATKKGGATTKAAVAAAAAAAAKAAAAKEQSDFRKLKARVDAAAAQHGLSGKVHTEITKDGLLIRLLTDGLLFDSGSATLKPGSHPLLSQVAQLLATEPDHNFFVQGNTDNVPIHSGQFANNMALSQGRAQAVWQSLVDNGISPRRAIPSGRGQYDPLHPNTSPAARSLNRRVEILVPRTAAAAAAAAATPVAKASIAPSIRPHLTPSR